MSGRPDELGPDTRLFDHIDALRVLRADDEEKSRVLEEIGVRGEVERELVGELAPGSPVLHAAEFEAAHANLMRALEVLDRNGPRRVTVRSRWGPLRPVFAVLVQVVTRWIVRSHVKTVARSMRRLYERRQASATWGSPEFVMLRRARKATARVESGLGSDQVRLPTFLLGGAFLTGGLSAVLSGVLAAARNISLLMTLVAVTVLLLVVLSWVAIYAAAVARHRIRLTTDWAVADVYRTLGAAGLPPRDFSYIFAVVAVLFLVAAVLVLPFATWLFFDTR